MTTPAPERISTTGKVVEYLRRAIETGALSPGDRITELEISGKLGVSRSPVREALATLAQEGVVTIIPYRGAIVSTVDADRFAALAAFRLVLEEFALREFIAHATELDYARIVSCVKNPFLERTYAELLGHFRLYATLTTTAVYENLEELADEHDRWIEAVRRGDTAGALAIMRAHIELGFAEALERLRAAEAVPAARNRHGKR
jgi:DNA-binding GntR family transcriptional regulator